MQSWFALAALCACLVLIVPAHADRPKARLSPNRMLMVGGRPRFIIGLYENPASDERLRQAVEAGFNLIHCAADRSALDRVHAAGAWVWVNTGYALDLSEDADNRRKALQDLVGKLADHPALLVWEGPDEALWNCWYGPLQQLEEEHQAMRHEADARPDLRPILNAALDRYHRALWAEWEILRNEFWRQSGKSIPYPNARLGLAEKRASAMGQGFTAGARYLRSLDPQHFIWLNHAPRNSIRAMREHNRAVDMAGCDIYPIPSNLGNGHSDLGNVWPSCVGDYTDRMRQAAPGKACAMVLQGFGWSDLSPTVDEAAEKVGIGRRPTLHEQRFMAWDAIVHGANAIMYWGTAYLKEPDSDAAKRFWNDLLSVVCEVRSLERFIVEPDLTPSPSVRVEEHYASNDGSGVRVAVKRSGEAYLLIVVNERSYGLAFSLNGLPSALEGKRLRLIGEQGTEVTVRGRALRDGIVGWGVRLYATE